MDRVDTYSFDAGPEVFGPDVPISALEHFVHTVQASVDEAATRRMDRLRSEDGITATCELGCHHCCRHLIPANIAEAHALVQYVRREFSAGQLDDLRMRTQRWHEWDHSRPGRHPSASVDEQSGVCEYEHTCPMLVNGNCSVYPVRPFVCRTHYVCTPPLACATMNDPASAEDAPVVLRSIVTAASPLLMEMRDHIESEGLDDSRSTMLLPHWLAIKMGWDFAISP
ncbi:MAG: hypothetical protein QGI83_13260 [Candidatus Latescibacteria bacterium]|nr:hypothetical protein [Candidatus Latescibacterota bacterium]